MPKSDPQMVLEGDVFRASARGRRELQESGTSLSAPELELLVLLDGKSTLGETAARVRTRGRKEVFQLCEQMLTTGLIEYAGAQAASLDFIDFFGPKARAAQPADATAHAREEAAATALMLKQKGYYVRIARRPEPGSAPAHDRKLCALVIEDEPHLGKVLKHILESEGFEVRLARNKAEIVEAMRRAPLPDIALLDVVLPDVDGFEVLDRIRDHPALKQMTVVMLTAEATRDAVLRGLAMGADGYITKPFEIDVLLQALGAVLDLPIGQKH